MPTGYSAPVVDGEITDTHTYARRCLRAFGVAVMQRDQPLDEPVPRVQEPDLTWYNKCIKDAQERLEFFENGTEKEIRKAWKDDLHKRTLERAEWAKKTKLENQRIDAMIAKIEQWDGAPSNFDIKGFMIDQLNISRTDPSYAHDPISTWLTPEDYRQSCIRNAKHSIEYNKTSIQEEIDHVNERNKWMNEFENSLIGLPK